MLRLCKLMKFQNTATKPDFSCSRDFHSIAAGNGSAVNVNAVSGCDAAASAASAAATATTAQPRAPAAIAAAIVAVGADAANAATTTAEPTDITPLIAEGQVSRLEMSLAAIQEEKRKGMS